jgi:DNA polymerase III subunit epsilon
VERVTRRPLIGRRICTVKLARRLLPQLRRRNLDALQHFYGVENHARHRAGGDAVATAAIFIRMLNTARVEHGCATVDELERLASRAASRKKRKRRPPAMPHSTKDDSYS